MNIVRGITMKKKITAFAILIALISGMAVLVVAMSDKSMENYREWGAIDAQMRHYFVDVKDNAIVISNEEIDALVKKASLFNSNYSRQDAENFIIRRETLYNTALREGYTVSDEEADAYVQLQIDMSSKADNPEAFSSALDNINARQIEEELLKIGDKLMISVTHSIQPELLSQYEQVVIMENGAVKYSGRPSELTQNLQAFLPATAEPA